MTEETTSPKLPQPETAETTEAPEKKLRFDEKTFKASQDFASFLLGEVPELLGLAIIPTWEVPQEHLSFGVVMSRYGLQTPVELVRMIEQLAGTARVQFDNLRALLAKYDEQMGVMAKEIDAKEKRLQELNEQLEAAGEKQT